MPLGKVVEEFCEFFLLEQSW